MSQHRSFLDHMEDGENKEASLYVPVMFQEVAAAVEEDPSPAETLAPVEVPAPAPTPAGGVSLSISQGNNPDFSFPLLV